MGSSFTEPQEMKERDPKLLDPKDIHVATKLWQIASEN